MHVKDGALEPSYPRNGLSLLPLLCPLFLYSGIYKFEMPSAFFVLMEEAFKHLDSPKSFLKAVAVF